MSMDEKTILSMTAEEADALFAEIADLEIKREETAARFDDQIAELKREQTDALSPLGEELLARKEELSKYILAHPERFQKPRKRPTPHGTYGLAQSSMLQLNPAKENELIAYADRNGLELYSREVKLDKKAIAAALREGRQVPGAAVVTGDIATYKVNTTYKPGGEA